MLTNHTYDDLTLGQSAELKRRVSPDDVLAFAAVSGDLNPAHLDADYAATTPFRQTIAHGMFAASLISALLGTRFPGPGTIYLNQSLSFRKPVHIGDTLTVRLTVKAFNAVKRWVTLACQVDNQNGETVLFGDAEVIPPATRLNIAEPNSPRLLLQESGNLYAPDYPA